MIITWWKDENNESELRKYLYLLENIQIVIQERFKTEESYEYKWKLTKKGEKLIIHYETLAILLKQRDMKGFYEEILRLKIN